MKSYPIIRIQDMALEDRPREKCARIGLQGLSNSELIAILLGTGSREESALNLAARLLHKAGNDLYQLGKLSLDELKSINGIGEAKAVRVLAAIELGKRRQATPVPVKKSISCSRDAYQIIRADLSELPREEFWVLLLSRSNRLIEKVRISQGGVSGTITDIRIILQSAFTKLSSAMILCHNHPSGNLKPSQADIKITKKISEAAKLMDISVLDHIIIGDSTYFSFADENLL
jgi:DNA repair protein RadC